MHAYSLSQIRTSGYNIIINQNTTFFSNTIQKYEFTQTLHDFIDVIINGKLEIINLWSNISVVNCSIRITDDPFLAPLEVCLAKKITLKKK